MNKLVSHAVLPLLVLGGAVVGARSLVAGTEIAQSSEPEVRVPVVQVLPLKVLPHTPTIELNGVAEATRRLTVVPQVEGRLSYVSPQLVEGGRIRAGSVLVKIEQSSLRIALDQAEAETARAEAELQLELGRSRTAGSEWQQFGSKSASNTGELARRTPQLASARALVALRKAQANRVKLDLERTTIRAPFNAIVQEELVEKGQVVARGGSLCTLIASDEVWVRAPIELRALALLSSSSDGADLKGRDVQVQLALARDQQLSLAGKVLRLAASVDTLTRKAEMLVRVNNPETRSPLLPGSFVTLKVNATTPIEAVKIPREAWLGGKRVWLVDHRSRLVAIEPKTLWTDQNFVYVDPQAFQALLETGTLQLLPRALPGALNGMQVQLSVKANEEADRG